MNPNKLLLVLMLSAGAAIAWAQTNVPPAKPGEQGVLIHSDGGYFDGLANQVVYVGHVLVTDHLRATLTCERLTVGIPQGGTPTNILAETNVVADFIDEQGMTNHVTANTALYSVSVVNSVTNQVVTFSGGDPLPKVENPRMVITGEPMVYNVLTKRFSPGTNFTTILKPRSGAGNGTNGASPFNFLK